MGTSHSIQDVARLTGLSAHTLRYYERIGLLSPIGRAPGGQRRYAQVDLDWITFLQRLRATGMPIRDMLTFARLRAEGSVTVPERRALLEQHLLQVRVQIAALDQAATALSDKIRVYIEMECIANEGPSNR